MLPAWSGVIKNYKRWALSFAQQGWNCRNAVRVERVSPKERFHNVWESIAVAVCPGVGIDGRETVHRRDCCARVTGNICGHKRKLAEYLGRAGDGESRRGSAGIDGAAGHGNRRRGRRRERE